MGFLNVLSQSGSEAEHLEEFERVAAIVQQEGFKCVEVSKPDAVHVKIQPLQFLDICKLGRIIQLKYYSLFYF